MAGISGNRRAARAVAPHDQSAADPAIGAGGAHLGPRWRGSSHNRSLLMITRVVMAELVTASRIYPTCGALCCATRASASCVPSTSSVLHGFQDADTRDERRHDDHQPMASMSYAPRTVIPQ